MDGPNGVGRLTVSALAGDGGGLLANINRWRGQMGLPAVDTLDEQPTTKIGGQTGPGAVMVDLSAEDPEQSGRRRMIAAVLSDSSKTIFFKMTGSEAFVEGERQAFEQFVRINASPQENP